MKTQIRRATVILTVCVLACATSAVADIIEKADTSMPLNTAESWVGGIVPGPNDIASFSTNFTSRVFTLGEDLSWLGLSITGNPGGNPTFNLDSNTLTLGAEGMYLAPTSDRDYTFNNRLALSADQTWTSVRRHVYLAGGLALDGHTLTLSGNNTKEFRKAVTGAGRLINTQGTLTFSRQGVLASGAELVLQGSCTFNLSENAISNQTDPFCNRLSLHGSTTANLHGSTTQHAVISNATALSYHFGGQPIVAVHAKANYQTTFISENLLRIPQAGSVFIRGTHLGQHDPADSVPNTANVLFLEAPALSGHDGMEGTTNVSILPGVLVSTNSTDTTGIGLATYDLIKGVRPLDIATEYTQELVDGEDNGNNLRIENVAGAVDSATKVFTITNDTAINSLSFRTSGSGVNGGIVIEAEAESDAVLKINSGVIFASLAVSSPNSDKSSMVYLHAPIDLNGQQGLVHHGIATSGMSNGNGNGLLEITGCISNDNGQGIVFAGAGSTHFNSGASTYTGPTIINSGFLRLLGQLPGHVILNGGSFQCTHRIPDWADITINAGTYYQKSGATNSGDGGGENFNTLYMTGGNYTCGSGGGGTMIFTNAYASGGVWGMARGTDAKAYGDVVLSGTAVTLSSGNGSERNGAVLSAYERFIITNTLADAYQPLVIGYNNGTRNEARLILTNPEAGFFFFGNPENTNTTFISANAIPAETAKRGAIRLVGEYPFDIGNGAAEIDLYIGADVTDNGTVPGGLVKLGAGTLQLAATNTYTLGTRVEAGALLLDGATLTSQVDVFTGAVFGGTGTVQSNVVLAANAGLALSPTAPLAVEGTIAAGGTVEVTLLDAIPEEDDPFLLASATSVSGTFVLAPEFADKWHVSSKNTGIWLSKNTGSIFLIR